MKKQIALATTAAALLSTGAYASKARMQALGQDTARGSYFLNDTRNVFRNAADVNSMNNYVVIETGAGTNGGDADTNPVPEGGIFRNAGSLSYGLYFGSDVNSQNGVRVGTNGYAGLATLGNANLADRQNELDLFIGGDMGVEWGARISYAKNKNKTTTQNGAESKQSSFGIGLGMNMGDLGAHLNLGLSDKSEDLSTTTTTTNQGHKWEADTTINAGFSYGWNDWTFFAEYDTLGAEYTAGTSASKDETSQDTITVGAGHTHEVSSTSMVFTEIQYNNIKAEDKDGADSTNNIETKTSALPVTLGFETDATSWLALRASISQRVILNSAKSKTNNSTSQESDVQSDSTDVAMGATLNFGKLKVDGMIGTDDNDTTNTTAGNTEIGTLRLDRLMTRVGVHYWF